MRNMIKSLFFPPFLQRFDEKLLLNRPWLWSTRLHRVAWPALLLALLSIGLGMFTPVMRPYSINQFISLGTLGIVLAQIGLVIYWLYGQDAYSVEREHGVARDKTGWREFGTYLGALGMIGLSLFLFLATVRNRAQTVNDNQFARDLFLLHLISDMEYRDDDLFEELMGQSRPVWNAQTSEAQGRENDRIEMEYYRLSQTRERYEMQLLSAASRFVPDGKGKLHLLKTYIFNNNDFGVRQPDKWWNEEEFLIDNLDMGNLTPLRLEWEQGDYSTLFETLSRYSGTPLSQIEKEWKMWAEHDAINQANRDHYSSGYGQFRSYGWQARSNVDSILNFAFNPTFNLALVFWAILGAIAVHLSLLRFTFKHSGLKGFLVLLVSVVGVGFAAGLYTFIGSLIDSQVGYRGDFMNIGYYGGFMDNYMVVGLSIALVITLSIFAYTRTIPRRASFTWKMAIGLYILPILLALTPYMILGIEEIVTNNINGWGWFSTHFIENPQHLYEYRNIKTWSVAPLGWYIVYVAQFAYMPLLGWLKRSHTRLMSLPR